MALSRVGDYAISKCIALHFVVTRHSGAIFFVVGFIVPQLLDGKEGVVGHAAKGLF